MNRRTIMTGATLLGGFIAGCMVGGSFVFHRLVTPMAGTLGLVESVLDGNEAYIRYRYGSYSVAKPALLSHADRLRTHGPVQDTLGSTVATSDLRITYGRLAVAAARAGQQEDAARYFDLAVQTSTNRDQTLTHGDIRSMVDRLDASWDKRLLGSDPSSQSASHAPNQAVQRPEPSRSANQTNWVPGTAGVRR